MFYCVDYDAGKFSILDTDDMKIDLVSRRCLKNVLKHFVVENLTLDEYNNIRFKVGNRLVDHRYTQVRTLYKDTDIVIAWAKTGIVAAELLVFVKGYNTVFRPSTFYGNIVKVRTQKSVRMHCSRVAVIALEFESGSSMTISVDARQIAVPLIRVDSGVVKYAFDSETDELIAKRA